MSTSRRTQRPATTKLASPIAGIDFGVSLPEAADGQLNEVLLVGSGPRRPTFARRLFIRNLCELELWHAAVLRNPRWPTFINMLCDCRCCNVGTGYALCSEKKKGLSFTRGHCEIGFCRGSVLCDCRKEGELHQQALRFQERVSTGRASVSGPRRPSITRRHCEVRIVSWSAIPRGRASLCDCCGGVVGHVFLSGPGRPSFTRRHCALRFMMLLVMVVVMMFQR